MKKKLIISLLILFSLATYNVYADNEEDATAFYNEGIDLYKQNDIEKSIELFTKAIELNPNFYEAHYNLAQILISVGKNEEALEPLKAIYKLQPENTENLYNLGRIQYKRGYLSNAHEYLIKISSDAPQYDSAKIILDKIDKRQKELDLENKIKEHKAQVDSQGRAKGQALTEIPAPSGSAVDDRGNIYVASFSENLIYKISVFGQKTVLTKSVLIRGPIGVAIDNDNNIYVANYTANNIIKIAPSNNNVTVFADIQKPYTLTYDKEHNRLYATEQNTNKIMKFDL